MKNLKWANKKNQSWEPNVIEKDLCTVFSPEWLRKTAQETGLIKRERKVDPTIMFWVLVLHNLSLAEY